MTPSTDPLVVDRNGTPTLEVPEILPGPFALHPQIAGYSCLGCVFNRQDNDTGAGIPVCRWLAPTLTEWSQPITAVGKTCLVNKSIFIEATPEALAGYIALRLS